MNAWHTVTANCHLDGGAGFVTKWFESGQFATVDTSDGALTIFLTAPEQARALITAAQQALALLEGPVQPGESR